MASSLAKLELEGFEELSKKFDKLTEKVKKKALRPSLRAGAKVIQAAAKSNVPVKTGNLKKSIKIKAIKPGRKGIGVAVKTGSRTELGIPADRKDYYPSNVEYGSRNRPASRFMNRALSENSAEAIKVVGRTLGPKIEEIARKAK